MPSWEQLLTLTPDLAKAVQARFDATGLGLLATLRADGSPRISGIEPLFADQVWLGMMPGSRKARDLQRDGRMALHSATVDKLVTEGDARVTGRAVEHTDEATLDRARRRFAEATGQEPPPGPMHLFSIDVTELVLLRPAGDHLDLDIWTEGGGTRRVERF